MKKLVTTLLTSAFVIGSFAYLSAQEKKGHTHEPPGREKTTTTKLLEAGAELTQGEGPINAIHQHVCGFHFYAGDMQRQVRAHHYCSHQNEEVLQCVIYDSHGKDARLIGIEYIISEQLFQGLPEDEKKLWHSHRHEVMSGTLIAPGVPDMAEKEVMKKLVNTYGKTWHTWQVDRGDKLPLGLPKLMMSFTADSQLDVQKVLQRDRDLGTNTTKKRAQRADLPAREVQPGADAWQANQTIQISDDLLKGGGVGSAPRPQP